MGERGVRSLVVVQLGCRTPTVPPNAGFSTSSTHGPGRSSPIDRVFVKGGVPLTHRLLAGGRPGPECRRGCSTGRLFGRPRAGAATCQLYGTESAGRKLSAVVVHADLGSNALGQAADHAPFHPKSLQLDLFSPQDDDRPPHTPQWRSLPDRALQRATVLMAPCAGISRDRAGEAEAGPSTQGRREKATAMVAPPSAG